MSDLLLEIFQNSLLVIIPILAASAALKAFKFTSKIYIFLLIAIPVSLIILFTMGIGGDSLETFFKWFYTTTKEMKLDTGITAILLLMINYIASFKDKLGKATKADFFDYVALLSFLSAVFLLVGQELAG